MRMRTSGAGGSDRRGGNARRGVYLGALALAGAGIVTAALAAPASKAKQAAPAEIPIIWTDLDGRGYGPIQLRAASATVFIFFSTECPVTEAYLSRIRELENAYYTRGARVFMVSTHPGDTVEKLRKYAADHQLVLPLVKDPDAALAERLGATVTPEAVVVGREGQIHYRGRIDDSKDPKTVGRRDLAEAVEAVIAGKPVALARTKAEGCELPRARQTRAARKTDVTYSQHIAPILNKHCADCHRPGEVAPFSLLTYKDARLWARMIKDTTHRRIMPPWKPLVGYGDFHDARALSAEELDLLAKWADGGTPEGDRKLAPKPAAYTAGWTLGKPDVELSPEVEYQVPAEGRDEYRCFVLPAEFKQDAYINAVQIRPGNRAVVHHVIVYIDPTGKSVEADEKDPAPGFESPSAGAGPPVPGAMMLSGWAPGNRARYAPPGMAMRVPKGARLVMEVHYHKSGRPEMDRSSIGLSLARDTVQQVVALGVVVQPFLRIPAGEARAEVKASGVFMFGKGFHGTLPEDMTLHGIAPHMHQIGEEMRVWATLPDGKREELLWLKDWDFNWQEGYQYRKPLRLPKGTKIDLVAYFNNSTSNPRNPHRPPKVVTWGEQTSDEMCIAFLSLTRDGEKLGIQPAPPAETVVVKSAAP